MSIATALQGLQQAKIDIANAIMQRNGVVNSGDGFADFAACISTIPQGSSQSPNFEIHRITLSSNLTASNSVLLSNVQFIKDHMNDDSFTVTIIRTTPIMSGSAGVGFVYRGNRPICEKGSSGSGYYYGVKTYSSGSSSGNQSTAVDFSTVEWNGFPNVDSTGKLFAHCNETSGAFLAGEYLVMLCVMK